MSLSETIERVSAQHNITNEQEVKSYIVSPILADLGWQIHNPSQVSYEKRIATRTASNIDIVLLGRSHSLAALLHLGAPGAQLENHLSQILRYARLSRIQICVLTNGIEWVFYLPFADGPPDQRCFLRLRLPDTTDHSSGPDEVADSFQRYLGRRALLSHSAEVNAEAALRSRHEHRKVNTELPKLWKQMTYDADPDLIALIKKRAQEEIGIDISSSAVERTLARKEPIPTLPKVPETSGEGQETKAVRGDKLVPALEEPNLIRVTASNAIEGKRPIGFVLFGQGHKARVTFEVLVLVAETLFRQYPDDFYSRVEPLWGNYKPWISQDHRAFIRYRPIAGSPYYLDVNLSVGSQAHRWCELLKAFGYDLDALTLIYHTD